jgi:hypothetical protein
MSIRLARPFLLCLAFGLAAIAVAAPPASTPPKESKIDRLHDEKLDLLQQVPEVHLFTDEQITTYRDKESGALGRLPRRATPADRLAIRHACNLEMRRAFVAAGLREGLPLRSKGALLPVRDAAVMQTLSKELRDLGFVSPRGLQTVPKQSQKQQKRSRGIGAGRTSEDVQSMVRRQPPGEIRRRASYAHADASSRRRVGSTCFDRAIRQSQEAYRRRHAG